MNWRGLYSIFPVTLSTQVHAGPDSVVAGSAVPSLSGYLSQSFIALVVIVGAIFLVVWLLRRYGGFQASNSGRIRVIDGVSVGQKERVLLLRVGAEHLVVGVAQGQISDLGRVDLNVDEQAEVSAGEVAPKVDFPAQLARLMNRGRKS